MSTTDSGWDAARLKYARREFERRFLLAAVPEGEVRRTAIIHDRYVAGTRLRLRRSEESAGSVHRTSYKLTQKIPAPDGSPGFLTTIYLDEPEYRAVSSLEAAVLDKTRLSIPPYGIDVFSPPRAGLLLAEVEFETEAAMQGFVPPSWAICEVTRDGRFTGARLAATLEITALLREFGIRAP